MAVGDDALAGRTEVDITYRFPPDYTKSRTIYFKGLYLSIYNQQTGDYKTHKDNESPAAEFERFEVPIEYTVYVRAASVYFEV